MKIPLGLLTLSLVSCGGARCTNASGGPIASSPSVTASASSAPPPASVSSATPSASASAAGEPPLIEREDIPLGKKCRFRLVKPDPTWTTFDAPPAPEWERRKGRRFISCHFRLHPKLPVLDVEIATAPGENIVNSVTIKPSDGSFPPSSFEGVLTFYGWEWWDIEATDVNFDGINDLVMPQSAGSIGCIFYHWFVFDPEMQKLGGEAFVDSNANQLCNPKLDRQNKLVTAPDLDKGRTKRMRWGEGRRSLEDVP